MTLRRFIATAYLVLFGVALLGTGTPALAAEEMAIVIRPHCEKNNSSEIFGGTADIPDLIAYNTGNCVTYSINDPSSLRSPPLKVGDILDIDLVLQNPNADLIRRVRSWLSYDPEVLEGVSIELNKIFSVVTPGEADFSPEEGYVKIGAAIAEGKEVRDKLLHLARLKFKVIAAPKGTTSPLSFFDQGNGLDGHTFVSSAMEGGENLLRRLLGSLMVSVPAGANNSSSKSATSSSSSNSTSATETSSEQSSSSSETGVTESSQSSTSSITSSLTSSAGTETSSSSSGIPVAEAAEASSANNVPFTLLQVQNVRITTKDTSLMVAWDPLRSPLLKGYNVYYGKQMGRYIHRHSLDKKENSLMIRDRELGQIYYVSVRAVGLDNQESAFSQEVAVRVGEAGTSTSPLLGRNFTGSVTENPVVNTTDVPGASGMPALLLIALTLAATGGFLFAVRRQVSVLPIAA